MNEFVFLKLVNGEQIMAIKESEDAETVLLRYPMLVKTHMVGVTELKVSEQVTAGPYSLFSDIEKIYISKQHIILNTVLAERAIPHYIKLVQEHEGVNIVYKTPTLDWDDIISSEPETLAEQEAVADISKAIAMLRSIAEEEEPEGTFIEGNDTLH